MNLSPCDGQVRVAPLTGLLWRPGQRGCGSFRELSSGWYK